MTEADRARLLRLIRADYALTKPERKALAKLLEKSRRDREEE